MPDLLLTFGLIAIVLVVTALASGAVERSPLTFPLLFLGLGFLLGEGGLGLFAIGPHSPVLEVVATLTLSLVLFLDAIHVQVHELGRRWLVPFLILVPGTGLIILLTAVPLSLLLGFGWMMALVGGAVLASTDPVVLREIVRDPRIPRSIRQVLKIEAGMNDIVVLPVILVLIAAMQARGLGPGDWSVFLAKLLLLGPAIGFIIGGLGSWSITRVDHHLRVRREHQAVYGIGLVLAAYAAATLVGGDGFLSAFAAGLAVTLLNQSLCDCFLEFGEVTPEMAMLLAFVLFGAVLSGMLGTVNLPLALALAGLVVFIIRPVVLNLVLARARMSWEAKLFVSWFGPRGLNSLLLALLVVQAGIPGAEFLLGVVGTVVVASVAVHGASGLPVSAWYQRRVATDTLAEERESTADGLFIGDSGETPRITPEDLQARLAGGDPPAVLDVRSRSSFERDAARIPGSIRVFPDQIIEWAGVNKPEGLVVAYCT